MESDKGWKYTSTGLVLPERFSHKQQFERSVLTEE